MKVGIVRFPGSHGAANVADVYSRLLGASTYYVHFEEEDLKAPDLLVLPGGFAFGDYVRPGGLTKGCNVSGAIRRFARDGGAILGLGNGFQVLCELGVLPGAFLVNPSQAFCNEETYLVSEGNNGPFMADIPGGTILQLPMACYSGRFYVDQRGLNEIESEGLVAFRYSDKEGDCDFETNFNGSVRSIAGLLSRNFRVLGLMPHPERRCEELLGGTDGLKIIKRLFSSPSAAASA